MNKCLLVYVVMLCSICSNYAQEYEGLFFELGGSGGLYSLNYETKISEKLNGRIGGEILDFDELDLRIIGAVNYLQHIMDSSYWEFGITISLATIRHSNTLYGGIIGYRYQPEDENTFYRVSFTPLINNEGRFMSWIGISFGTRL